MSSRRISQDTRLFELWETVEPWSPAEELLERFFYSCLACPHRYHDTLAECADVCGYRVQKVVRLLNQCLDVAVPASR